jgi:hypothetical protein
MDKMKEVRLIDGNALAESDMAKIIDGYLYNQCNLTVGFAAALMPEIEAKPVKHGRWETINPIYANVYCSECGAASDKHLAKRYKGCPYCLCVMDATDTNVGSKGGADNDS